MDLVETENGIASNFSDFAAAELAALVERLTQKHQQCLRQLSSGSCNLSETSSVTVKPGVTLPAEPNVEESLDTNSGDVAYLDTKAVQLEDLVCQQQRNPRITTNSLLADIATFDTDDTERWLRINVVSGASLRDADMFLGQGSSDPYCTCQIRGKPDTMFSTQVVPNSLNPVWNHQDAIFDFDIDDILEFTVKDRDFGKSDDVLGFVSLPLKDVLREKFEGTLMLDSQGVIRVEIEIESDDPRTAMLLVEKSRKRWPLLAELINPNRSLRAFPRRGDSILDFSTQLSYFSTSVFDGKNFTFRPNARSRVLWATVGTVIVVYDFISLPVLIVFEIESSPWLTNMTLFIAIFWALDMMSMFFTGFEHQGVVEMRLRIIAQHYIKTWFFLDLSLIALDWFYLTTIFLASSTKNSTARIFRLVKIARSARTLRILGLLHMWKLSGIMSKYGHILHTPKFTAVMQVCEALGVLAALSHVLACIWYGLGIWVGPDEPTWVRKDDLETRHVLYRYSTSYHWVLTQFTPASMSVQPMNSYERIFTVCLDFVGIIIFSTFVSTITQKTSQLREFRKQHINDIEAMKEFLKKRKVSFELSTRVLNFVIKRNPSSSQAGFAIEKVIGTLPVGMQRELHTEVHVPHLLTHGFFRRLQKIRRNICPTLAAESAIMKPCAEGNEIFQVGQNAKCMYFIVRGLYFYCKRGTSLKLDVPGWIGEPGLWVEGWLHRGGLLPGTSGDIMELDISGFTEKIIMSDDPMFLLYVGHYASHFVRRVWFTDYGSDSAGNITTGPLDPLTKNTSIMQLYSDIWGTSQEINAISKAAYQESFRSKSEACLSLTGSMAKQTRSVPVIPIADRELTV